MSRLMRDITLSLSAIFICNCGYAARNCCSMNNVWSSELTPSSGCMDVPLDIAVDGQGHVAVCGYEDPVFIGGDRFWRVAKYDSSGNLLWSKTPLRGELLWGKTPLGYEANGIAIDTSGNLIVVGEAGVIESYWVIMKYEPNGNMLWGTEYIGSGGNADIVEDVAVDTSGDIYAVGSDYTNINRWMVRKYDSNGNFLWSRTNSEVGVAAGAANGVVCDSLGNVYVAGTVSATGSGVLYDWKITKYDTNGTMLWNIHYNGEENEYDDATGIRLGRDGFLYVYGSTYLGNVNVFDRSHVAGRDLFLKIDTDGNIIKRIRPFSLDYCNVSGVAASAGGNIIAIQKAIGYPSSICDFGCLNASGNVIWRAAGGNDRESFAAIDMDDEGNLYTVAYSDINNNWITEKHLEADPFPCMEGISESTPVLFPNPVKKDTATLAFLLKKDASEITVEVFNMAFKRIYSSVLRDVPASEKKVTINGIDAWAPGMYLLKMRAKLQDGGTQVFHNVKVKVKR